MTETEKSFRALGAAGSALTLIGLAVLARDGFTHVGDWRMLVYQLVAGISGAWCFVLLARKEWRPRLHAGVAAGCYAVALLLVLAQGFLSLRPWFYAEVMRAGGVAATGLCFAWYARPTASGRGPRVAALFVVWFYVLAVILEAVEKSGFAPALVVGASAAAMAKAAGVSWAKAVAPPLIVLTLIASMTLVERRPVESLQHGRYERVVIRESGSEVRVRGRFVHPGQYAVADVPPSVAREVVAAKVVALAGPGALLIVLGLFGLIARVGYVRAQRAQSRIARVLAAGMTVTLVVAAVSHVVASLVFSFGAERLPFVSFAPEGLVLDWIALGHLGLSFGDVDAVEARQVTGHHFYVGPPGHDFTG